jgi:hypothetical protein
MSVKKTLELLLKKINDANKESIKANSYSDGYLDCIKDILDDNLGDLSHVLKVKHDGKVRNEVYSEIIPVIEKAISQSEVSVMEQKVDSSAEESFMHPQERTRSFLERIGRK